MTFLGISRLDFTQIHGPNTAKFDAEVKVHDCSRLKQSYQALQKLSLFMSICKNVQSFNFL